MNEIASFLKQAKHFLMTGDLAAAKYFYFRAAEIDPNSSLPRLALGTIALKESHLAEAKAHFLSVLSLDNRNIDACLALGAIAMEERSYQEGLSYYEKALFLDDKCLTAYNDLCLFYYHEVFDFDKALYYAQKSFAIEPRQFWVSSVLSELDIFNGNWQGGFSNHAKNYPFYENYDNAVYRAFEALPLWQGENFSGKRLIIGDHAGFGGFGDIFLLARWLKALKARGGRVVLPLRVELIRLFEEIGVVDEIIAYDENEILSKVTPENFDLRVPLIFLPGIFGISEQNVGEEVPYLWSNPSLTADFSEFLKKDSKLRVGIVWASGKRGNPRKTCGLEVLKPLFEITAVTWYSLQPEAILGQHSKVFPCNFDIIDLTDKLDDFAATAALIDNLDLVISVDTAAAHLAGAMGKPVWLILSYGLDWRWLKDINHSPWYPSMRIFRAKGPGNWEDVVKEIFNALQNLAKDK